MRMHKKQKLQYDRYSLEKKLNTTERKNEEIKQMKQVDN